MMTKVQAVQPCATKMPWATRDLAEGHVLILLQERKAKDATRLHAYRCPYCPSWHVGHGKKPR